MQSGLILIWPTDLARDTHLQLQAADRAALARDLAPACVIGFQARACEGEGSMGQARATSTRAAEGGLVPRRRL